ncbi:hypothetical protein SSS_01507 [Sarcoptes scabiei]|uniref:Uncharacterized protein n=1 Tax=Sarcoptes scabiei TaxID=52283 RepID=A0A834R2Q8_SARSC|nr:hypothetical protein SSS_01507 [Sarcoptes scabiei]
MPNLNLLHEASQNQVRVLNVTKDLILIVCLIVCGYDRSSSSHLLSKRIQSKVTMDKSQVLFSGFEISASFPNQKASRMPKSNYEIINYGHDFDDKDEDHDDSDYYYYRFDGQNMYLRAFE